MVTTPDLAEMSAEISKTGSTFHLLNNKTPMMFQVLGERCSGTNVVRKTIEKNSNLLRSDGLGWKHGFPSMVAIPREMIVVCAFRNAVSWVLSMHRRPWHLDPALQELGFSDFLRSEWRTIVDRPTHFEQFHPEIKTKGQPLQLDRHPITGEVFENIFAMRRAKIEALMGLRNRDCGFAWIQLESLQSAPETFMDTFRAALALPAKDRPFRPVTRRLGNRFKASVKSRPETPSQMSADDLAFLRANLDLKTEAMLGYSY